MEHAKLHDLNDVPGVLLCSLLSQFHSGTGLCQSNQRLQLSSRDGSAVLTLTILTKLKVKFLNIGMQRLDNETHNYGFFITSS